PPPTHPVSLLPHPPPPQIYTLSLHDALPILEQRIAGRKIEVFGVIRAVLADRHSHSTDEILRRCPFGSVEISGMGESRRLNILSDRKSTRLNSSHVKISYAVFCLKKKKKTK